jgi:hypothetical protein
VHAEQPERTGLFHQPEVDGALLEPVGDVGPDAFVDELADRGGDVELVVGEQVVDLQQVERTISCSLNRT